MKKSEFKLFPLRFSPREAEKAFLKSHQNVKEIRIILLFAMAIFVMYIAQDYLLFSEYFLQFLLIRLCVFVPLAIILLLLTFNPIYEKNATVFLIGIVVLSAAGIILMEFIAKDSPYAGLYFFGIAQILMFFYGTGKVPFVPSCITGGGIIVAAVLVDALFVESDTRVIITKALFIFTMGVIGLIISTIIQYSARMNFVNLAKIEKLSITDTLTGLHNRCFYENVMKQELLYYVNKPASPEHSKFERAEDLTINRFYGIVMLDIDHFKTINDNYSHTAGDLVLKEFSRRISGIIRANDVLIRWGGEEFLLILRNTQIEYIRLFVGTVRNEVSGIPFDLGSGVRLTVTVSGGVLLVSPKSEVGMMSSDIMIELADEALYRSKSDGRNRFTLVNLLGLNKDCARTFEAIPT